LRAFWTIDYVKLSSLVKYCQTKPCVVEAGFFTLSTRNYKLNKLELDLELEIFIWEEIVNTEQTNLSVLMKT